ncbi:MAG: hypothetical protein FJZ80_02275 [Bacteroidetes bacterium]|nr:hypothetical protein [Bacteroidota bacterium]
MDQRVQRFVAELCFPVVGVLFWNWSTAFLMWFIAVDAISGILVGLLHPVRKSSWTLVGIQIMECALILLFILSLSNSLMDSFWAFFFYKDMGIAQGYLLIPLVFLGEWLRVAMSKKTGVYWFYKRSHFLARIGIFTVLLVFRTLGLEDVYLSLSFIFLYSWVILWIRQDVILI